MTEEQLKILLIEHDSGFAQFVGDMLGQARDLSVAMRAAADLNTGLEALRGERYDLLLVDLCAPDGAGLANVALFKAEAPGLPIIAAGDADDEIVALEAVQAGAQDYLVKGQLTPSWLERSIRYAIERHRMDRALLEAEEKYHSVFDHLVEGIFQTTAEGRYLMANAALARIYGYGSPEELIQDLTDIGRRLYVEENRRSEFVRLMQENDVLSGFQSQVHRKDGSVIWISENCRAVRDTRGRLLYYEGTVEDITQRRQAEENVRNSEALYHSLVETLPQNIFRKDTAGRFTFANRHFRKNLGRRLEEIVGKTDSDFFPEALAKKYQQDDQKVMETGQSYETVEEHKPPGRETQYVQVIKTPLYDAEGRLIGLQGLFWDITQQRRNEESIRRAHALLAESQEALRARNLQMEDNLKMAREIQLTMLPQQYPAFPGCASGPKNAFRFTHRYLPAGSVGGDFFTISALSDHEVGVFICDVAGHGVRSALVTAMIRALVEELKPEALDPGQFLNKLNRDLYAILKHTGTPMLTTGFYLVADCRTGTMRYANAGHPKPLLARRSSGQVLPLVNGSGKSQPALGLFEGALYQSSDTKLLPEDLVLLFTDGLVEVENNQDELYSPAMLSAAVERRVKLAAPELFDALLTEIQSFARDGAFADDVCLVGVEFGS